MKQMSFNSSFCLDSESVETGFAKVEKCIFFRCASTLHTICLLSMGYNLRGLLNFQSKIISYQLTTTLQIKQMTCSNITAFRRQNVHDMYVL